MLLKKAAILLFAAAAAIMMFACTAAPVQISRAPVEGPDDYKPAETAKAAVPKKRTSGQTVTYGGRTWEPRDGSTNVLLIGVDNDATRHEVGRSDMLILCTFDPDEPGISFLTIPRDTHAYVYHLDENGAVKNEVYEKINHAYTYGGGPDSYSAQNAMACTSRLLSCGGLLSVPIHYFVSIDLDGLAELAGVFGGVEVEFDQTIPGVGNAGEVVNLQGPFVRYYLERRHDMSEGEVSRQKHQQTFLKALLAKIKDQGMQNIPELYGVFTQFMDTNLSLRQCLTLAQLLNDVSVDEIRFSRITGEGVTLDGVWYLEPDNEEMTQLVLESQYREE